MKYCIKLDELKSICKLFMEAFTQEICDSIKIPVIQQRFSYHALVKTS